MKIIIIVGMLCLLGREAINALAPPSQVERVNLQQTKTISQEPDSEAVLAQIRDLRGVSWNLEKFCACLYQYSLCHQPTEFKCEEFLEHIQQFHWQGPPPYPVQTEQYREHPALLLGEQCISWGLQWGQEKRFHPQFGMSAITELLKESGDKVTVKFQRIELEFTVSSTGEKRVFIKSTAGSSREFEVEVKSSQLPSEEYLKTKLQERMYTSSSEQVVLKSTGLKGSVGLYQATEVCRVPNPTVQQEPQERTQPIQVECKKHQLKVECGGFSGSEGQEGSFLTCLFQSMIPNPPTVNQSTPVKIQGGKNTPVKIYGDNHSLVQDKRLGNICFAKHGRIVKVFDRGKDGFIECKYLDKRRAITIDFGESLQLEPNQEEIVLTQAFLEQARKVIEQIVQQEGLSLVQKLDISKNIFSALQLLNQESLESRVDFEKFTKELKGVVEPLITEYRSRGGTVVDIMYRKIGFDRHKTITFPSELVDTEILEQDFQSMAIKVGTAVGVKGEQVSIYVMDVPWSSTMGKTLRNQRGYCIQKDLADHIQEDFATSIVGVQRIVCPVSEEVFKLYRSGHRGGRYQKIIEKMLAKVISPQPDSGYKIVSDHLENYQFEHGETDKELINEDGALWIVEKDNHKKRIKCPPFAGCSVVQQQSLLSCFKGTPLRYSFLLACEKYFPEQKGQEGKEEGPYNRAWQASTRYKIEWMQAVASTLAGYSREAQSNIILNILRSESIPAGPLSPAELQLYSYHWNKDIFLEHRELLSQVVALSEHCFHQSRYIHNWLLYCTSLSGDGLNRVKQLLSQTDIAYRVVNLFSTLKREQMKNLTPQNLKPGLNPKHPFFIYHQFLKGGKSLVGKRTEQGVTEEEASMKTTQRSQPLARVEEFFKHCLHEEECLEGVLRSFNQEKFLAYTTQHQGEQQDFNRGSEASAGGGVSSETDTDRQSTPQLVHPTSYVENVYQYAVATGTKQINIEYGEQEGSLVETITMDGARAVKGGGLALFIPNNWDSTVALPEQGTPATFHWVGSLFKVLAGAQEVIYSHVDREKNEQRLIFKQNKQGQWILVQWSQQKVEKEPGTRIIRHMSTEHPELSALALYHGYRERIGLVGNQPCSWNIAGLGGEGYGPECIKREVLSEHVTLLRNEGGTVGKPGIVIIDGQGRFMRRLYGSESCLGSIPSYLYPLLTKEQIVLQYHGKQYHWSTGFPEKEGRIPPRGEKVQSPQDILAELVLEFIAQRIHQDTGFVCYNFPDDFFSRVYDVPVEELLEGWSPWNLSLVQKEFKSGGQVWNLMRYRDRIYHQDIEKKPLSSDPKQHAVDMARGHIRKSINKTVNEERKVRGEKQKKALGEQVIERKVLEEMGWDLPVIETDARSYVGLHSIENGRSIIKVSKIGRSRSVQKRLDTLTHELAHVLEHRTAYSLRRDGKSENYHNGTHHTEGRFTNIEKLTSMIVVESLMKLSLRLGSHRLAREDKINQSA